MSSEILAPLFENFKITISFSIIKDSSSIFNMFSENSVSFALLSWLTLNESFITTFSSDCISISSSAGGLINKNETKAAIKNKNPINCE